MVRAARLSEKQLERSNLKNGNHNTVPGSLLQPQRAKNHSVQRVQS
jgi:hypothetical protein